MGKSLYSLALEIALTAWIKRVKRKGYARYSAEKTLIRAVHRRFDRYYENGNL